MDPFDRVSCTTTVAICFSALRTKTDFRMKHVKLTGISRDRPRPELCSQDERRTMREDNGIRSIDEIRRDARRVRRVWRREEHPVSNRGREYVAKCCPSTYPKIVVADDALCTIEILCLEIESNHPEIHLSFKEHRMSTFTFNAMGSTKFNR